MEGIVLNLENLLLFTWIQKLKFPFKQEKNKDIPKNIYLFWNSKNKNYSTYTQSYSICKTHRNPIYNTKVYFLSYSLYCIVCLFLRLNTLLFPYIRYILNLKSRIIHKKTWNAINTSPNINIKLTMFLACLMKVVILEPCLSVKLFLIWMPPHEVLTSNSILTGAGFESNRITVWSFHIFLRTLHKYGFGYLIKTPTKAYSPRVDNRPMQNKPNQINLDLYERYRQAIAFDD